MESLWSQLSAYLWPILLGGAGGYAYHKFIGCRSGVCPITANPWISTLYGVLIGLLLSS